MCVWLGGGEMGGGPHRPNPLAGVFSFTPHWQPPEPGPSLTCPFPRERHDLLIADLNVRLLTADGVNALEASLQIVAGLLQGARVVSVLALVDV